MKLTINSIKLYTFATIIILISTLKSCMHGNTKDKNDQGGRPNIVIIVADDFNYDSPGFMGEGVAPDITPNLDKLAAQSLVFEKAFTTVSVCQPSRQSMLSGKFPHNYGSRGFFPMEEGTLTLPALLKSVGYLTGNIHKEHHMQPVEAFAWDYNNERLGFDDPDGYVGSDPVAMASALSDFIDIAQENTQPFFIMVNSADPHRPFEGDPILRGIPFWGDIEKERPLPSRIYTPEEVNVPPTLPDIPGVREDLAKYASSVRRLDDWVGQVVKVLDEKNKANETILIFVSDNGMALPFAKFEGYHGSNRTPLIIRWPQKIIEAKTNKDHLISLMDITPTILEITGVEIPSKLDGRSLVPFLENKVPETWRQSIVALRNEDIYYGDGLAAQIKLNPELPKYLESQGWIPTKEHKVEGTYVRRKDIRTYYDGRFGYIYNDWFREDGLEIGPLGAGVPYGDPTLRAMREAAKTDSIIEGRVKNYLLRAPEELYDWDADPGSQVNLIEDPDYMEVVKSARQGLLDWMKTSKDPLHDSYAEKMGLK